MDLYVARTQGSYDNELMGVFSSYELAKAHIERTAPTTVVRWDWQHEGTTAYAYEASGYFHAFDIAKACLNEPVSPPV